MEAAAILDDPAHRAALESAESLMSAGRGTAAGAKQAAERLPTPHPRFA